MRSCKTYTINISADFNRLRQQWKSANYEIVVNTSIVLAFWNTLYILKAIHASSVVE